MDFGQLSTQLRAARDVMLIFCAHSRAEAAPLLTRPAPIVVPPLAQRSAELNFSATSAALAASTVVAMHAAPATSMVPLDAACVAADGPDGLRVAEPIPAVE